jgi:arginyl-tRNA synthetase
MQFVSLAGGASMSKRAGTFVTLDELLDEIGVDATRWFLLKRSHDTTIELDLDLAVQQSKPTPSTTCSTPTRGSRRSCARPALRRGAASCPQTALSAYERALIQRLLAFPAEVAEASDRRSPHRIATYALELAQEFTLFYDNDPILKEDVPEDVRAVRLALAA